MKPNFLRALRGGHSAEAIPREHDAAVIEGEPDYAAIGRDFLARIGIPAEIIEKRVSVFGQDGLLGDFLEDEDCREHMYGRVEAFRRMKPGDDPEEYEGMRQMLHDMVMRKALEETT